MRLHTLYLSATFLILLAAQRIGAQGLDCCQAVPFAGGSLSIPSVDGPGAEDDSYAGTCLATGEHDAYFLTFEAQTSGTFEMMLTPDGLNADYDFALLSGGCPGNAGTNVVSCSYIGPITAPGPFIPTGIADDPQASFGVPPNPEINPTVNLVAGTVYVLILDNITENSVGFFLETGGSAVIGPPSGSSVPPMIDPAGPFCEGDPPVLLNATPPGGTWSGPFVDPTGFFNPSQVGNYTITYTAAGGLCPQEATTVVTVLPGPDVQINPPPPLCEGGPPVTLSATPPGGIWGGAADATGVIDPTVLGPGTFQVTYTVTGPNGCEGMADALITITPLPQPDIIIPGPYCLNNGPQQLTAVPPGGTFGNSVPPSGLFDPLTLGVGTFAVTYTYTDPNGCTNTVFEDITIVPGPTVGIEPAGPFCEDDPPQQLVGTPPGGVWSGDVSPTGLIVPQVDGPGPKFVTYTYIDANGCQGTADAIIEVLPLPLVQIDPPPAFCSGGNAAQLTAFPAGGVWTGPVSNNGIFDPSSLAPGNYPVTYTYTDANGCQNSDMIEVAVNPGTPPTILSDGAFCEDEGPVELDALPAGGTWSGNVSPIGIFDPELEGPGIYMGIYTFTDAAGCGGSDTLMIEVSALPAVEIAPAGPFCESESSTTFSATPPGGNWSGDVTTGGTFNPSANGAGSYQAIYDYTDAQGCSNSDTLAFEVTANLTPTIDPAGPFCADDSTQQLSAAPSGGTWSGDAAADGSFAPSALGAGSYQAIYTAGGGTGCEGSDTLDFTVNPAVDVVLDTAGPFCESEPATTLNATPAGGNWSGDAAADGSFDPQAAGPGSYTAVYEFTSAEGCSDMDSITVDVLALPTVEIDSVGPYCSSDPIDSLTASPDGGVWSGDTDSLGRFDPMANGPGTFAAIYTVTDSVGCTASDTFSLVVNATPTPAIAPAGPFCTNEGPQSLNGTPAGGAWGGDAQPNGDFDPAALGAGSYTVSYSLTSPEGCSDTASANINVLEAPSLTLSGGGSLCQGVNDTVLLTLNLAGTPPYTIRYAIDGVEQPAIVTSNSVFTLPATTPGAYTAVAVESDNGCVANGSGNATVVENGSPIVADIETNCNSTNTEYVVSFEISGGDPASYSVSGDGTLSSTAPYVFTSDPIPNGTPYDFVVDDANGCNPTSVSGNFSCDCTTDAGTMDTAPAVVCEGEIANLIYNNDATLDPNDTLIFVLHDNNGTSLGNILSTNDSPSFSFSSGLDFNTTYYVSAVAADTVNGGVDFNSVCLSVSLGAPLTFYPLPTAAISGDTSICAGGTATLTVNFTGTPPFELVYNNGQSDITLSNLGATHSFSVSPAGDTDYQLVSVTDSSPAACSSNASGSALVAVSPNPTASQTQEICQGDSLFLAGDFQTVAGQYVDTLVAANGCDSILTTDLIVNIPDTTLLSDSSCDPSQTGVFEDIFVNEAGCDSVVITTIDLLLSDTTVVELASCNPVDTGTTETLLTNSDGCDSLVITTTVLLQSDTTLIDQTSCDPADVGTTEALLTNSDGCDSLVITTTTLLPSDTTFVDLESCNPQDTGTVENLLNNQFGCDSLVVTTTTLLPSDTTFLGLESCNPQDTGTVENLLSNQFGCDSLVVTTTTLLPSDTTFIGLESCNPQDTGTVETLLSNQFGCDSLIVTTTTLLPSDTTFVDLESCNPQDTGTVETLLSNQFGCDSLIVTTTTLLPSDTTFLGLESCNPQDTGTVENLLSNQFGCDSLIVTTTTLLPSDTTFIGLESCNPQDTGTVETLLSNQFGCDSLVVTTTTLLPSDTTFLSNTSCDPAEVGVTEELLSNQFGCDSLVVTTTTFVESDTTTISLETCDPEQAGTVTDIFTNQNGCDSVVFTVTTLVPLEVDITAVADYGGFGVSCPGASDGMGTATVVSEVFSGPLSYQWSNGETTAEASMLSTGTQFVTVTSNEGCVAVDSVIIEAPDSLQVGFTVNQISCFDDADGQITANVVGGVPPYLYNIDGEPFQSNPAFSSLSAGEYMIGVQDANGCESSESILISEPQPVTVDLGEDISIRIGEEAVLNAMSNIPPEEIDTVLWEPQFATECPTCLEQVVSPLVTTAYMVEVVDINGCSAADEVRVFVDRRQSVYFPSVFSPNGDDNNDIFRPFTSDRVERIDEFQVYNRWGEPVFEAYGFEPNSDVGWDGTFRGQEMNPGVFVFTAVVTFRNGTTAEYKGDVTLMR
ncbi:MAG: T9SS type B sorting domain-containing protein [Bacteroidetes bacterium]|jgi:gliding motility-associated-like protein|nr:T9SS type B sorting domain-containing protein [Bacteroidota bacterium]